LFSFFFLLLYFFFVKMSYRRSPPDYYRGRDRSPYRYSRRSPSPIRYRDDYRRRSPPRNPPSSFRRGHSPRGSRGSYRPMSSRGRYSSPKGRRNPIIYGSETERNISSTLFVGNLPYNFHEREVRDLFERCGRLGDISIGINKRTGESKGYAFISFEERHDAETAFNRYNGFEIDGRRLRLDWDIGYEKKKAYTEDNNSRPQTSSSSSDPNISRNFSEKGLEEVK